MNRPDLNKLAKEVYQANKEKGSHDTEQSNETLLMLVITELSKAIEADRKNKRARWDAYDKDLNYFCNWDKDSIGYKERKIHAFSVYIKDTVEDELADAVIRLLDLAGLRGLEILQENFDFYDNNVEGFTQSFGAIPFADQIWHCIDLAVYSKFFLSDKISESIAFLEALCNLLQIDLWQHVELKLKYNQTRPMKHGKRY